MKLSITSDFEEDLIAALEWTLEHFGNNARNRYIAERKAIPELERLEIGQIKVAAA